MPSRFLLDPLRRFLAPLVRPRRPFALHPLLFAAYAVLFLYTQNLGEAALDDVVPLLVRVAGIAAVLLLVATLLLRDRRRAAILVSAAVVAYFAFGHVETLIAQHAVPVEVQEATWIGLIGLAFLVAAFAGRLLDPATRLLDTLAAVFVLLALVQIIPHEWTRYQASAATSSAPPVSIPGDAGPGRDIYYLVFDRYGSETSLRAGFGIDNDLPEWLTEQGFTVAPLSHANHVRTTLSLAGTLNLDYWHELAERQGPRSEDYGPLHRLLGDHAVGRFLKERGYRYEHIGSWFGPTKRWSVADVNHVWETEPEFEAVLAETTAQPVFDRWLGTTEIPSGDRHHLESALFQFRALEDVIRSPGPKFVTAHILLPHDPYVFDEEGRYVPKRERAGLSESEQFARQLAYTNRRIREVLQPLLSLPEERRPIIVIQADEGPYPPRFRRDQNAFQWASATPSELEMKYGILSAFMLPGLSDPPLHPSISPVNTFRLIFSEYFGADLPLLEDRSYASPKKFPYDLIEVTHRIPSLQGVAPEDLEPVPELGVGVPEDGGPER